ncbi:hypothetical protein LguiA_012450 [Lonicera macranthoides]
MLSGLKFIPRDQIDKAREEDADNSAKGKRHSSIKKVKERRKKKKSRYSSSDDEDLGRIKKGSRKKKKWYSSNEDSSSSSDESESGDDQGETESRSKERRKKKSRRRQRDSSFDSENESDDTHGRKKGKKREGEKDVVDGQSHDDFAGGSDRSKKDTVRRDMGLEWMLRPKDDSERTSATILDPLPEEATSMAEEIKKANPRELNPYLKDNGSGYPDENTEDAKAGGSHLLSSSVVGDGGASWRLKALKRAQEQAARDGRKLDSVVEERWGSLGQLAVSVASRRAAHSHAHLHAIKDRKRGQTEEQKTIMDGQDVKATEKNIDRERRQTQMRVPKPRDSLSWGKRRSENMSSKDASIISSAMSSLNKFSNDGSFMREMISEKNDESAASLASSHIEREMKVGPELVSSGSEKPSEDSVGKLALSANQLAAKVMQLRMKGKHVEADKLMKEAEKMKATQGAGDESSIPRPQDKGGNINRYIKQEASIRQKKKEEDADMNLAQTIMQNKQFKLSGQADDEYDYDEGPRRKIRNKGGNDHKKSAERSNFGNRILTQQERCQFCFENPSRPRHLVVAIANFTYLMLPQWQPVVPGHCCILPMQHESSTRGLDNNVWDEIRNFKKCLIMMFAKQEKDVVFLETVMGIAQQRRHCLVECIPLPQEAAKQAPLYFKKAIDEAEDEWSQHNAKKLIDTSEKGLRGSIPKDFPYFHVEFGLKKGFVHVIDDEKQFQSNFGLNVVRGILKLPAEDMHRRRAHVSMETQKEAVADFAQDWAHFDWTKQLD